MKILRAPITNETANDKIPLMGGCDCSAIFEATEDDKGVKQTYSDGWYCNCPFCGRPTMLIPKPALR